MFTLFQYSVFYYKNEYYEMQIKVEIFPNIINAMSVDYFLWEFLSAMLC